MTPTRKFWPVLLFLIVAACGGSVESPPDATAPSVAPATIQPAPESTATPVPSTVLAVVNGTLLDGTGSDPIVDGVVLVDNGMIVEIGPSTTVNVPDGVQVLDAGGGTVMPGLVNAHVHGVPEGVRRLFLEQGVTSVCETGANRGSLAATPALLDSNRNLAARHFRAGPFVGRAGGYPSTEWVYEVFDPASARAVIADLSSRGADYIKIGVEPGPTSAVTPFTILSADEIRAVVDEAHSRGLLVRAHVDQADMLELALDGGVDVVDHMPEPDFPDDLTPAEAIDLGQRLEAAVGSGLRGYELLTLFFPEYDRLLQRMVDQGIVLVPTLEVFEAVNIAFGHPGSAANADEIAAFEAELEISNGILTGIVGRYAELGGAVALGSDYGGGVEVNARLQISPLREMELLSGGGSGLTNAEIVVAATQNAARACGHGDEIGTLEPGKLADLIVLDGDPLADLQDFGAVQTVMLGGEVAYQVGAPD